MQTILSYGMGVESTAILVRWLEDASVRPCPLDELILITAHTGDEYADTCRDVETYVLPLLRKHGVRYVQVARAGHSQADGIVVLSDSFETERLFWEGAYKLSDELRAAGTVPQFGGEHICSLKFKAWVIEQWFAQNLGQPARHAFGYNASETKRVAKSEAANARRVAFGFNAEEHKRIDKAMRYDSPLRQSFYPLVEWGWTRDVCLDYLHRTLGILWHKSACVQCPFNALKDDALRRHLQHPEQVADAMMLEHVSLALNPRGTLYRNQSLIEITDASGNRLATESYRRRLDGTSWAVYRVRRIYYAAKAKDGTLLDHKKGTAIRSVERLVDGIGKAEALAQMQALAIPTDEVVVLRGIRYFYRQRCATQYPTREEFLVAAPAVVEPKARYGLDWFEEDVAEVYGTVESTILDLIGEGLDYTDLIAFPSLWASGQTLRQIAMQAGLDDACLAAFLEDPDAFLQTGVSDDCDITWIEHPLLTLALDHAWECFVTGKIRRSVRTAAIVRVFANKPGAGRKAA